MIVGENEICDKCQESGEDRRTLWMSCFYAMNELEIPFTEVDAKDGKNFFTLRVCKECRSDWMHAIKSWFFTLKAIPKSCGSGIFIRDLGHVREITDEEWRERHPDREPVRVKPE